MIFFYGGPLSQWAHSPFTLNGINFNTAEQWMMYSKAMLFGDFYTSRAILASENPEEQKALGRSVARFDDVLWCGVARTVVFAGNVAKFSQNMGFKACLKATGNDELVEASPTDCRWGVGLSASDPRIGDRKNWRGENWLGKVLMDVRRNLCG